MFAKSAAVQRDWLIPLAVGLSVVPSSVVVMEGSLRVEQRREWIAAARQALTGTQWVRHHAPSTRAGGAGSW